MNTIVIVALAALMVLNVFSFALYGADKKKAQSGAWRISEKALIGAAACFGAAGALIAMKTFRHKTQHKLFTVCVPLFLIIQVILLAAGAYFLLK